MSEKSILFLPERLRLARVSVDLPLPPGLRATLPWRLRAACLASVFSRRALRRRLALWAATNPGSSAPHDPDEPTTDLALRPLGKARTTGGVGVDDRTVDEVPVVQPCQRLGNDQDPTATSSIASEVVSGR